MMKILCPGRAIAEVLGVNQNFTNLHFVIVFGSKIHNPTHVGKAYAIENKRLTQLSV
ncbi:hypothetical protein [Aeromonas hydrophila]|uniref:hypothetical protein n=1 Tax=Aeromonas hydrophila TaxID=644 RepID=UPI0030D28985